MATYCDNWITNLGGGFNDETRLAMCETYYWVNKKADLLFPYAPLSENYKFELIVQIIESYQNGVINGKIPEWVALRNPAIEKKIIDYLVKQVKKESEKRIRAVFATMLDSYFNPGTDRYKINPCVIFPKSEDCKTTPLSLEYLGWREKQEREGNSGMKDASNLAQSLTILTVCGVASFFAIKFFALK